MHLTQSTQLMGYGGLAHCESISQRADAHLSFDKQGDNPHAAGVAEGAEELGKLNGFEFGEFHGFIVEYMNKYSYIIVKEKDCQDG